VFCPVHRWWEDEKGKGGGSLAVLFLKQASWHEKTGVLMRVDRAYLSPDLFGVHRGVRGRGGHMVTCSLFTLV
jgi:hypothetical protein